MKKTNIKLSVIDEADYDDVKEFLEFAKEKGYKVTIVDNGNFIFEKEKK